MKDKKKLLLIGGIVLVLVLGIVLFLVLSKKEEPTTKIEKEPEDKIVAPANNTEELVNEINEKRRGKKLFSGDFVKINGKNFIIKAYFCIK